MHIAFLDANTDRSAFAARHPTEVQKFRTLLGPRAAGWEFSDFTVNEGHFPDAVARFDGVMISGSPASVNDPDAWIARLKDTIRAAVAAEVPVFGACFGHQAVASALGGVVGRNPQGWVLGRVENAPHSPAPWMDPLPAMALHAAHNEQVTAPPPGARVLGGNADVPNGHLALGKSVFTTQYHPELDEGFMRDLLGEMQDKLAPDVHRKSLETLGLSVDDTRMADWIAAFFRQAR